MAYISTNEVKEIRKSLKDKFGKNIKFSVTRDHHSSVNVSLMEGVIDFYDGSMDMTDKYSGRVQKFDGHAQINHYHTHMYGEHKAFFDKVHEIIKTAPIKGEGYWKNKGWYDNSDSMIDYFDTAYYISMNVGSWNVPYVQK